MPIDIRSDAAKYYDLNPGVPDDVSFYRDRLPGADATVLELGCGTGRVLVPLAESCAYVHGVDLSPAMIAICQRKLAEAGIPDTRARAQVGDITNLELDRGFDLIISPFRVFQNLETDAEVDGYFDTVRKHLAPEGQAILTAFNPNRDKETMRREWASPEEYLSWEVDLADERVASYGRNARIDREKMVFYPELIYRTYQGAELVDEAVLKIVMRCYYPDEFERLVTDQGFEVLRLWGGYHGEPYGEGPELVIEFADRNP